MSLRRQLFISFLFVAILPLITVAYYLYNTNVNLAFDLYKQSLYNSTAIQTDMLNENIRQFMLQSAQFSSSKYLEAFLEDEYASETNILQYRGMLEEIRNITDNTLGSVIVFSIIDKDGQILYKSGSNTDGEKLKDMIEQLPFVKTQTIFEIPWNENTGSLLIASPVLKKEDNSIQGMFVAIYNSDYFLKTISSHRQVETSNSFIYCKKHKLIVKGKREIIGSMDSFFEQVTEIGEQCTAICYVGDVKSLVNYSSVSKTHWILVNSIPVKHINSYVLRSYGLVSLLVVGMSLMVIVVLSRKQSIRILQPLNQLLKNVEDFFNSNKVSMVPLNISKKTEIGYLGDKFTKMAIDTAATHEKLNESNYLYNTLLHANYALQVIIHVDKQWITASNADLSEWFDSMTELTASEKLILLFKNTYTDYNVKTKEIIHKIVDRSLSDTVEMEACFDKDTQKAVRWYRVIVVPIMDDDNYTIKAVLHFEDITAKKYEELRLLESSQRDPLCKLLNKQALLTLAQKYTVDANKKNAVFFIDLDNFKQVNDTLGHGVGDELLIKVSNVLRAQFRADDLLSRYGGDEFVIFAPGMSRSIAELKGEALLRELSIKMKVNKNSVIHVTASIGISIVSGTEKPENAVTFADNAMYSAKKNGKYQYFILDDGGSSN